MGLVRRRRGASSPPRITAFAFGPQNFGWAALTVLFLASDGGVYVLCPVAPFGMRVRAAMLRQLPGIHERGTVHTWLLVGDGWVGYHQAGSTEQLCSSYFWGKDLGEAQKDGQHESTCGGLCNDCD